MRLAFDDRRRCRGTAATEWGQEAAFDCWLALLGVVAGPVERAAPDSAEQQ